MPLSPESRVSPVELVALAARLNQDEQRPRGELLARDRALAEAFTAVDRAPGVDDADRLAWWLEHSEDPSLATVTAQTRSALSMVGFALVFIGLLLGAGAAVGVYVFDGERPVNVVAALGVFVFLQAGTLLLAVLAVLPAGWTRWLPGFGAFQELLRQASPGRLSFVVARLMPQEMREALAASVGRAGAHRRVYGRVQLWAVVRWSQLFAVSFNAAAAAMFVSLVVFTDLLFVWSTTLDIEPDAFHGLTSWVALPWAFFVDAVPTLELVTATRFQRGTGELPSKAGGAWWSFVLLAMLVYGLLPRVLAWVWAKVALGRASRAALAATPGATAVLQRLRSDGRDKFDETSPAEAGAAWPASGVGADPVVVDWSRAVGSAGRARQVLGEPVDELLPAGGARSMDEDAAVVSRLGALVKPVAGGGSPRGVVVLVKLWEPPMLEVLAFLRAVRKAVGDAVPVCVCAVSRDAEGQLVSEDPEHLAQWRRRAATVGDPWLTVALAEEGGGDDA